MKPDQPSDLVLRRLHSFGKRMQRAEALTLFALLVAGFCAGWLALGGVGLLLNRGEVRWDWVLLSIAGAAALAAAVVWLRGRRLRHWAVVADQLDPGAKDRHTTYLALLAMPGAAAGLAREEIEEFFGPGRALPPLVRTKVPVRGLLLFAAGALLAVALFDSLRHAQAERHLAQAQAAAARLVEAAALATSFGRDDLAARWQQIAARLAVDPPADAARMAARELAAATQMQSSMQRHAATAAARSTLAAASSLAGRENPALREALLQRDASALHDAVAAMPEEHAAEMLARIQSTSELDAPPRPVAELETNQTAADALADKLRDALEVLQQAENSGQLVSALQQMADRSSQASEPLEARRENPLGLAEDDGTLPVAGEPEAGARVLTGIREEVDSAQSQNLSLESSNAGGEPDGSDGPDLALEPATGEGESLSRTVLAAAGNSPALREFGARLPEMVADALAAAEFEEIPAAARPAVRAYFSRLRGVKPGIVAGQ